MSWQTRTKKEGTKPELQLDEMLVSLGYEPLKRYQHEGVVVDDPNGDIRRLYPDTVVEYDDPKGFGDPRDVVRKVMLVQGTRWHDRTQSQARDTEKKVQMYVSAGFYVVLVSDWWFANEARKLRLRPMLDEALKSGRWIEGLQT